MKLSFRLLRLVVATVALSFAGRLYAQAPRQELAHAYALLKHANHNYEGHRAKALEHIEAAGKALNMKLQGDASEHERQWQSDQMLTEARHLLVHARGAFEAHDREIAAAHVDKAIEEIDRAISKEPKRQQYPEPYRH
jgi:hypothetical protein